MWDIIELTYPKSYHIFHILSNYITMEYMSYQKTTQKNGLRIITVPDKNAKAVTVLVVVGAGSKYEDKDNNGISHFLEHMFFKGTQKRPNAMAIAETLDRVGGVYNAFTGKEYTGYFAKTRAEHFDLALDWVSDIFLHSKIQDKEIDKERGVILEEINMYLDTPMQYVGRLWEKLLYGDQPAGWLTIGTKENISSFKRNQFTDYMQNHYSSSNTIVCVSGNFDEFEAKQAIKAKFKEINEQDPKDKIKAEQDQLTPEALAYFKKTDQTHLCLGVRGYDLFNPNRYVLSVLSVLLGGNMSSRLFSEVREKRGLAYYIHTESENYTDTGYLCTQAGIPNDALEQVIGLIIKEYKSVRDKQISAQELKKAKDYLKGVLTLSLESSDSKASFYAAQELLTGEILTLEDKCAIIDKVTTKDLQKVADEVFNSKGLNLAVIGPHKNEEALKQALKL